MATDLEVLLTSNAALNRRDVEGMLAVYAPDAVVADHRKVAFGSFAGHEELRSLYGGIVGSTASFHEDVRVLASAPGVIVAHCEATARLAADPTGPAVGAEYGFVATIRDGLISRMELFDDGGAALEASGLAAAG